MVIGCARVSTQDQNLQLQLDALSGASCDQVSKETATGTLRERPELTACLRTLRKCEVLVAWKLDRLARSLKDLVEIVHDLNQRGVGFRSLTESIDTTSSGENKKFKRTYFSQSPPGKAPEHPLMRWLGSAAAC